MKDCGCGGMGHLRSEPRTEPARLPTWRLPRVEAAKKRVGFVWVHCMHLSPDQMEFFKTEEVWTTLAQKAKDLGFYSSKTYVKDIAVGLWSARARLEKATEASGWTRYPSCAGLWQYWLLGSSVTRFQEVFSHEGKLMLSNGSGLVLAERPARLWRWSNERTFPPQILRDALEAEHVS